MKHVFSCVLFSALLGSAQAGDAPSEVTPEVTPTPSAPEVTPTPAAAPEVPPTSDVASTSAAAPEITPAPAASSADKPAKASALEVKPKHRGYATDQPEIFIRQRLFGRAHGLSLLTAACLELPAYSRDVEDTYMAWYAAQAQAIETIVRDLAGYYFGPRADEAQWFDLVRALNLPDSIEPAMGEITLHAACASLPEAIPRSRYALDKLLAGTGDADVLPDDVAVTTGRKNAGADTQQAPAPSIRKPVE